jgi:putative ABC transport system permease protein
MVRVNTNDLPQTVDKIEAAWVTAFPGNPFEFFFLDQYFNSYYESERQFRDLFSAFAILASVIGCLGLFGLSSFTAMQRTREIAIRKVLGSSIRKIVILLSADFLLLVGLGIVIAWPLSYWLMDNWLANYPYAVDIQLSSFLISGLVVVGVAVLTITYHILKSAIANPVKSLKYE